MARLLALSRAEGLVLSRAEGLALSLPMGGLAAISFGRSPGGRLSPPGTQKLFLAAMGC